MKLLILDFDGTIGNTRQSILNTMHASLAELGLPDVADADITALIGLPLSETFRRLAGITEPEQLDRAVATYRRIFAISGNDAVTLFPNVAATLARAHADGITIAIASSRGKQSLRTLCDRLGIASYITLISGEEDVLHKKPAPDMVNLILDHTGFTPDQALVVGDTTFDIQMGAAAHCATCAVTYGNHTAEQLRTASPTRIVDDFAQILQ